MWVPVVVVVVEVVEGRRQCAFWVVEIFLSTPNKICALWFFKDLWGEEKKRRGGGARNQRLGK